MLSRATLCLLLALTLATPLNGDALAEYRKGMRLFDKGDSAGLKDSLYYFKRALRENPYFFRAMRSAGIAYFKLDYPKLAAELLAKALKQQPAHVETNLYYARALMALGKIKQAKQHIDRVLTARPRDAAALFTAALYYRAIDRPDLAEQRLAAVKSIVPRHFRADIQLGLIHEGQGRYREAEQAFRRAVTNGPRSHQAHYQLGRFFFFRGNLPLADRSLSSALSIDPAYRRALELHGRVLFLRKKWKQAQERYRRLVRLEPDDAIKLYTLALINSKLVQEDDQAREQALRRFRQALQKRYNDEIIRYAAEEFLITHYPIRSPARKQFAAYHLERADRLRNRNQYLRAAVAYKRAIRVYPVSLPARKRLAIMDRGLRRLEAFYNQLLVIRNIDRNNTRLLDRIAYYRKQVELLPSRREGIRQYREQPSTASVAVFDLFQPYNTRPRHFEVSRIYGAALRDALAPLQRLRLKRLKDHSASSVVDAFRKARTAGVDYFVHGDFIKNDNLTVLRMYLRSTDNGALLASFRVPRRGNRRLFEIAVTLAKSLRDRVPLIGRIIRLKGERAAVNLGRNQGVKKGMVFLVTSDNGYRRRLLAAMGKTALPRIVAEIKIDTVDEGVSFGEVSGKLEFDAVSTYQYVVPKPPPKKKKQQ